MWFTELVLLELNAKCCTVALIHFLGRTWDKPETEQTKVTVTDSSHHLLSLHSNALGLAVLAALAAADVSPASSSLCNFPVKGYDG